MPSDVSGTTIRGWLVPDLRLGFSSLYAAGSTYEQAGPLPGVPEPQGDTEMVLEASGSQVAGSAMRFRATRPGQPRPDGGAFAWRDVADSGVEPWRGWDAPHQLSYFEFYDYTDTANEWRNPHAITLADATVVTVVMKSSRYVVAVLRNPTTDALSEVTIHDNLTTYSLSAHPTVLALPSGRLLCFFYKEDTTANENQVRMHYSDDDGATWALGGRACLSSALTSGGVNRTPHPCARRTSTGRYY